MNMAIIVGRLTADPELKKVGENNLCKLRVATNETYTDHKGVKKEIAQFHNIDVWGRQAESCSKYLQKGREVLIQGKIEYTKNPTTNVTYTAIKADRVQFIGGKGETQPVQQTWTEDTIPF